jgi:hypothetical protein
MVQQQRGNGETATVMINQSLASGDRSINCNGTGAQEQGQQQLQWQWRSYFDRVATSKRGNGDGGDRSIAIAMAMGKEDWGTGAGALGQQQQNSDCNGAMGQRSIDRAIVLFQDQCHVLWLLKTCKTCGRPLFVKLFLRLKQAPFDLKFLSD